MKNASTLFLRIVISLGGLFVLAFIILVMPEIHSELVADAPAWFYVPFLSAAYIAAVPFFFVLFQTFKLLSYIDTEKAFSQLSVKALKNIKYAAFVIGGVYAAILPFMWMAAQAQDAPGLFAIGLVITGTGVAVGTFASVLQMVLQSAIKIKKENDLTV